MISLCEFYYRSELASIIESIINQYFNAVFNMTFMNNLDDNAWNSLILFRIISFPWHKFDHQNLETIDIGFQAFDIQ